MATATYQPTIWSGLNAEWSRLADDPSVCREFQQWGAAEPALASVSSIRDLRFAADSDPDGILNALLRLHHSGRGLAARAVLQLMLPKAVRLARSQRGWMSPEDANSATVTCMLQAIDKYAGQAARLEGGRPRVATAIATETLHHLTRSSWRMPTLTSEQPLGLQPADTDRPHPLDRTPDGLNGNRFGAFEPAHELLEALVDAMHSGVISQEDARMLAEVYAAGRPNRARVAASLGVSEAALRQRCSRAVRALANARHLLVPAAA